tara:strand:- start:2028 stop:3032 length:1005 start_codon:yes stop_codon:yes gene_type:complete
MAVSAAAFSPKEFQCWIISDATSSGASGIHASNMHQLDVDSVSYPSLNVVQALDVRSGVGQTLKDEDFFQDNNLRVVELSLSGTLHDDVGHRLLLANICNAAEADNTNQSIAAGHLGAEFLYGAAVANNASSLTVVIRAADHTNGRSLEFPGMVVTNFAISADSGTEGGRYKFTATLQSGKTPDLNESVTACGNNVYANTTTSVLSDASGIKVMGIDSIMNSFTMTIDHPAVFTGFSTTGYQAVARGAKCAVTVDTQIKYDGETKILPNTFDTQTAAIAGEAFVVVNDGKYGIEIDNGVLTNVAFSEGDIMMLDCSIESVDDGTDEVVLIDLSE